MIEIVETTSAKPVHPRKAVLWERGNLLSQAVGYFLEASMKWNVVRVASETGVENLIRETKHTAPEVVILCQEWIGEDLALPLQLLGEQPCLKVVIINLENNLVQVYSKNDVILQRVSDLLSIVESVHFPHLAPEEEVRPTE